jgi:hypothetical protein
MLRAATVAALLVVMAITRNVRAHDGLVGTWELVSRTDRDSTGRILSETTLGAAPIGYLIYDAAGHVAAQLSARDRSCLVCDSTGLSSDPNNNANIGGYSAYFGRYQVDAKAGMVTHVPTPASICDDGFASSATRSPFSSSPQPLRAAIGRALWFGTASAPEHVVAHAADKRVQAVLRWTLTLVAVSGA